MTPEQRAALLVLRNELSDQIDGGEECQGHDTRITLQLTLVDMALGNPVDPWAALFHQPAIREQMKQLGTFW